MSDAKKRPVGRPKIDENEKRNKAVTVRLTSEEYDLMKDKTNNNGSLSDFFRDLLNRNSQKN